MSRLSVPTVFWEDRRDGLLTPGSEDPGRTRARSASGVDRNRVAVYPLGSDYPLPVQSSWGPTRPFPLLPGVPRGAGGSTESLGGTEVSRAGGPVPRRTPAARAPVVSEGPGHGPCDTPSHRSTRPFTCPCVGARTLPVRRGVGGTRRRRRCPVTAAVPLGRQVGPPLRHLLEDLHVGVGRVTPRWRPTHS